MARDETSGEEELLAELGRRFAVVEMPVAKGQMLKIVEAVAVVTAVGLGTLSALRSLHEMFPDVKALLRAEKQERLRTGVDLAPWDPAELQPYGWRESPVDDEGSALVPFEVYTGLEETHPWCEGDLFNWKFAAGWALNSGWHEAAAWIEDHVGEYLLGVYQGFDVE